MLHKTLCTSINAASAVLAEWIDDSAADGDDSAVRYCFEIAGDSVEAVEFWAWLVLPCRSADLDWFDRPGCLRREFPGSRDTVAVCRQNGFGMEYRVEWDGLELSGDPDLSVCDTPDGVAVRWSPRAELELSVAGMAAAFVLRGGLSLRPYEEED